MIEAVDRVRDRVAIDSQLQDLLKSLGEGKVDGVAYDTAWVARLAIRYPGLGFEQDLEWLRRNQHADGTWGAPLVHHHDRFVSTLAAITALQEAVREGFGQPRDVRRVQRGESALWRLVGRLGQDDSDTVGFPLIAAALASEATLLGLQVPLPPARFRAAYEMKVSGLLGQPQRDWMSNPISFSVEGLRQAIGADDHLLQANESVASSPAATAAYLMSTHSERALEYLQSARTELGSIATVRPIDLFEVAWSLNYLFFSGAITDDDPNVRQSLAFLESHWSPETGVPFSTFFGAPDLDTTTATFIALRWGGYPVNPDVFSYFESKNHFLTYRNETNPSAGSHLRLLMALKMCKDYDKYDQWVAKIINALQHFDENGSFWWDKWHGSPYYVNHLATYALEGIADDIRAPRVKWIMRTQNDDGGWGYMGESTPEETAYALDALLLWNRTVQPVDATMINRGMQYLRNHSGDSHYTSLWISKVFYTPPNVVKSVILAAFHRYSEWLERPNASSNWR